MKRCILMLLLLALILPTTAAFADLPTEYTLPYEGVVFEVTFLPGGDIILYGSFGGRKALDGGSADTTIARLKPDGTEIWAVNLPHASEIGTGSGPFLLSDGRYMVIHPVTESDLHAFFIDVDTGLEHETPVSYGWQPFFAVEEGIIATDTQLGTDSLRLIWYDLDGNELRHKDYTFEQASALDLKLIETDGALYVLALYNGRDEDVPSYLMKLASDGLLLWKQPLDASLANPHIFRPDGEGGVLLMGVGKISDDGWTYESYVAQRIAPDGTPLWEKEIDVRDRGLGSDLIRFDTPTADGFMAVTQTDDAFQLVTMNRDAELTFQPMRSKPVHDDENTICGVTGTAADEAGRQWVYYIEIINDGEQVLSFLRLLDSFDLQATQGA